METTSRLVLTADGSHSFYNAQIDQYYHSVHGARQESERVYIELGLLAAFDRFSAQPLRVFEMGFGTGLNALLTVKTAEQLGRTVDYEAVELYPLSTTDASALNFDQLLGTTSLAHLHEAPWGESTFITPYFNLTKHLTRLEDFQATQAFHVIFFDAFSTRCQPELWTPEVFSHMASLLVPGGLLTTYCAKGYVQRNLRSAGFQVEKHPGPAHKRAVLRAVLPA